MKIVYLAAGAANMFCGSCLHDNTLAAALRRAGEDVLLVPTYTPLRTDETSVSELRVWFGGVNVYLQQHSALFRHTPWFLDRALDSPALISWLAGRAARVDPAELGDLTVSMLHGEQGRQRKEVEKIVRWLERDIRPELVHLSNSMLSGMAREIGRRTGAPVVCTLSGEDLFLEKLPEPHYSLARAALRERAADVQRFVAMNNYYADFMAEYLSVERERIDVVPHGLKLDGHGGERPPRDDGAFTIGFLARICPEKGLHLLIEAFRLLCAEEGLPPLRLRVAGYLDPNDRPYLEKLEQQLAASGLAPRFDYAGELNRAEKIAFLQSLDVFALPTVYRESKGLPVLEAWANGVPAVLPAHGAFPELAADTGGARLCAPGDPRSLADELRALAVNRAEAAELGRRGRAAVLDRYNDEVMAERTRALYAAIVPSSAGARGAPPSTHVA